MRSRPSLRLAVAIVAACIATRALCAARAAQAEDAKPAGPPGEPAPSVERGYVAFTPTPVLALSDAERERLKVPAKGGVVVVKVLPGGPAEKAGLKVGDLLVRYAGRDVPDAGPEAFQGFGEAFAKIAVTVKVGMEVELVVEREGKPLTLEAVAISREEMERNAKAAEEEAWKNLPGQVGFSLARVTELTEKQRAHWKVKAEKGLVAVEVVAGGPAARAGMLDGEVVLKFAGQELPDVAKVDPKEAGAVERLRAGLGALLGSAKPGQEIEVVVERGGIPVTLKVTPIDGLAFRRLLETAPREEDEGNDGK